MNYCSKQTQSNPIANQPSHFSKFLSKTPIFLYFPTFFLLFSSLFKFCRPSSIFCPPFPVFCPPFCNLGGISPAKNPAKRFDRAIIFIRIRSFQW